MITALLAQAVVVDHGKEWIVAAIVALTPIVVSAIDWIVTKFEGTIPTWLKPTLATALGSLLAYLLAISPSSDPLVIALVGLAVAGIRQVVVHLGRETRLRFRRFRRS